MDADVFNALDEMKENRAMGEQNAALRVPARQCDTETFRNKWKAAVAIAEARVGYNNVPLALMAFGEELVLAIERRDAEVERLQTIFERIREYAERRIKGCEVLNQRLQDEIAPSLSADLIIRFLAGEDLNARR